jgi:hypothetical protein
VYAAQARSTTSRLTPDAWQLFRTVFCAAFRMTMVRAGWVETGPVGDDGSLKGTLMRGKFTPGS